MSTTLTGAAEQSPRPTEDGGWRRRRFPWWTVFGVVFVVALVIGSGVLGSSTPTAAQRATAIEADIRCPSCEDLSVAQSSAPTAAAVRATVRHQIAQGRSDQQIEAYLVSRYGASIELDPPTSGWTLLVWLVPLLVGIGGLAVVVVVLARRHLTATGSSGAPGSVAPHDDGRAPADPERVADRRAFLERSLADADAEYLAGDLADRDYLALRRRDMERLAALDVPSAGKGVSSGTDEKAVALGVSPDSVTALVTAPPASGSEPVGPTRASGQRRHHRRHHRRSWWFLAGAVAAFSLALIVAVTQFSSNRLPGQTPTGGATVTPAQQTDETLAQAATDEDGGQVEQAASLYQDVLDKHPANEIALAQLGWIEFETGHPTGERALLADARAKLDRAVQLDPKDYAARLYLGTVLLEQDGDAAAAVSQFRLFGADGPPAPLVSQAAPIIRQAFTEAGDAPPAWLPASSTTSSTSTSSTSTSSTSTSPTDPAG